MTTWSTDHEARGVAKLLGQFRKPLIEALLRVYLRQVQKWEDRNREVAEHLNIEQGFGIILDRIGKLVGRGRGSDYGPCTHPAACPSCEALRVAIRCQIRINRSTGVIKDFLDVARLSGVLGTFKLTLTPPAAMTVTWLGAQAVSGDEDYFARVLENFRQLPALGVRIDLIYAPQALTDTLRAGWSGDPTVGNAIGWSGDASLGQLLSWAVTLE